MTTTQAVGQPRVVVTVGEQDLLAQLASDVRTGMTTAPKQIPPRWLYDPTGSRLFERITELPDYYLTGAERRILGDHAPDIARHSRSSTLVELGPGSSDKSASLVDSLASASGIERFIGIDISETALLETLTTLQHRYPVLDVSGVVGDFTSSLELLPESGRRLVAILGGTIGNLAPQERTAFLARLAAVLRPGEEILLGVDLVKDPLRLLAAYDDPEGVTAAFEKNILSVLNHRLGASFDPAYFDYVARWEPGRAEIRMGLRARREHSVSIPMLGMEVHFAEGEEVHTESSFKFSIRSLRTELEDAGFLPIRRWTDPFGDFALVLARRGPETKTGSAFPARPLPARSLRREPTQRATLAPGPPAVGVEEYLDLRDSTAKLAAPLSPEDQTVQTMADVSPTKWHLAHTTWFFERFVLMEHCAGYRPVDGRYLYLWNSYYEGAGPRHPRPERGLLSRPSVAEVAEYRQVVDQAMVSLLDKGPDEEARWLAEVGLHHEQQHQELLLMDAKHVLGANPLRPAYRAASTPAGEDPGELCWTAHQGGVVEVGAALDHGFSFDNERPRHPVLLQPFEMANRLVTAGEWMSFMDDGGYERPELWLSDGWAALQAPSGPTGSGFEARAPLYWWREGDIWWNYTLYGPAPVDPALPVVHVSYYEADAYARWAGARLPTEEEWEAVAQSYGPPPELSVALHPRSAGSSAGMLQLYGAAWQWTSSAYLPYPGFRAEPGAIGEYNGKFMVGQQVLRGGAAITPAGHSRPTYRNYFPPGARWVMSGVRLARDA